MRGHSKLGHPKVLLKITICSLKIIGLRNTVSSNGENLRPEVGFLMSPFTLTHLSPLHSSVARDMLVTRARCLRHLVPAASPSASQSLGPQPRTPHQPPWHERLGTLGDVLLGPLTFPSTWLIRKL